MFQVHELLKLYDQVEVSSELLLFKIPSTWQVSTQVVQSLISSS